MKTRLCRLLAVALCGFGICAPVKAQTVAAPLKKTIHVFVALCDNNSQGIVPVPATLGNGNDPANNLYWGAMYGTKTFLKQSSAWELITQIEDVNDRILQRVVFKHRVSETYLVADAYRGDRIKAAIESFLDSAAGNRPYILRVGKVELGIYGNAQLLAYIGHNGLMDFNVDCPKTNARRRHPNAAVVLACKSKSYFLPMLEETGCQPLLLTTGFMAPEAYTLEAAINAWVSGKSAGEVRTAAAQAYNKYQKCGIKGASRLFYTKEN